MPYHSGQTANRAIPITDFAVGNEAPPSSANVTAHRIDKAHALQMPHSERSAKSTDEVCALLTELRCFLSRLRSQQAELERENTELRRTNLALQNFHASNIDLFELTGQLASVGGWELDLRSKVLFWTKETCRIHELEGFETPSLDEAIAFYAPEARPVIQDAVQAAIANGTAWDIELPLVTAKGRKIWVRAQGKVLYQNGIAIKLHGAIQNITDRKQAELARISLERYLRDSQKLEAVGSLAGGVAHDFNNILAAIIGNTDVALLSQESPEVISRCLNEIGKASNRGRELVKQILSFGRPRDTERKSISILPVVEESIQLLRATLPARVALTLEYSDDLPRVLADATQLEQVLVNLATNASQAMAGQPGHIWIKIDSIQADEGIRERLRQNHSKPAEFDRVLRLIVADDGPGMAESTVTRLFEPFFTTKPVGEGTGLGLAVVHGIIRTHQGAITVDSKLGQGATFTIYLPASQNSDPLETIECNEVEVAPNVLKLNSESRPFVLYVDDDTAVLKATTCLLEHQGFRVAGFSDQLAAMEALRSEPEQYDLVVADYNMPRVSGIDFAKFVRSLRKEIPIVIITGLIDDTLRTQAASVGVQELIPKPFSLKSFSARLLQVVASHSKQNGSVVA